MISLIVLSLEDGKVVRHEDRSVTVAYVFLMVLVAEQLHTCYISYLISRISCSASLLLRDITNPVSRGSFLRCLLQLWLIL